MGPPRVTALLPVWNGGAYLPAVIPSVLDQTLADLELAGGDLGAAMLRRYELLVAMRLLNREELPRLEAWLAEVA